MGARTNFTFKTSTGSMILYSHWGGETKAMDLANALNKAYPRIKMGDEGYALRVIVSQLIGPSWASETGFGIYLGQHGGEKENYPVTIDLTNQTVTADVGNHTIRDSHSTHSIMTEPATVSGPTSPD